jgi:hypothetical protein
VTEPLKALWYHHAGVEGVGGTAIILASYSAFFCKISIYCGKN